MKRQGTVRLSNLSKSGRIRIHTRTSLFQETVLIKYNLLSNITLPPTPHLVQSAHTCHTAALGWGRPLFHFKPLSTFTFLFSPPAKGGRLPSISPGPNGSCSCASSTSRPPSLPHFQPHPSGPFTCSSYECCSNSILPQSNHPNPIPLAPTCPATPGAQGEADPASEAPTITSLCSSGGLKPGTSPTSQEAPWCGLRCLFLPKLLPC